MEEAAEGNKPPEIKKALSPVGAITDAFKVLSLAAPNDAVRSYVRERHGLSVSDAMIDSIRQFVQ